MHRELIVVEFLIEEIRREQKTKEIGLKTPRNWDLPRGKKTIVQNNIKTIRRILTKISNEF